MFSMFFVQKQGDVSDGVPVPGHAAGAREAHGDDAAGHVGQVQVDPVLLVATFVLKSIQTHSSFVRNVPQCCSVQMSLQEKRNN